MRQLSEINKDIEEIEGKIKELRAQCNILRDERGERKFIDFCDKYGLMIGDVVHTVYYGDMMVCGIDPQYSDWILVRKIKKNGEPYRIFNHQSPSVFEGCKVNGHIEE